MSASVLRKRQMVATGNKIKELNVWESNGVENGELSLIDR